MVVQSILDWCGKETKLPFHLFQLFVKIGPDFCLLEPNKLSVSNKGPNSATNGMTGMTKIDYALFVKT